MIKYFFVMNISSNKIIFDKPRREKTTYKNYVRHAIKKINPMEMQPGMKGKKKFPSEERILFQKMDSKLLFAAITHEVKRDSSVYRLMNDFYAEVNKNKGEIKGNEELERWLKIEISKFNKGKRFNDADKRNSQQGSLAGTHTVLIGNDNSQSSQLNEVIWEDKKQKVPVDNDQVLDDKKLQLLIWFVCGLIVLCIGIFFMEKMV